MIDRLGDGPAIERPRHDLRRKDLIPNLDLDLGAGLDPAALDEGERIGSAEGGREHAARHAPDDLRTDLDRAPLARDARAVHLNSRQSPRHPTRLLSAKHFGANELL